jgi:hypothetical protein
VRSNSPPAWFDRLTMLVIFATIPSKSGEP